ncbi:MAG TPA: hypothetical protein VF466_03400 [Candidatus Saccharimonadales bacterium]
MTVPVIEALRPSFPDDPAPRDLPATGNGVYPVGLDPEHLVPYTLTYDDPPRPDEEAMERYAEELRRRAHGTVYASSGNYGAEEPAEQPVRRTPGWWDFVDTKLERQPEGAPVADFIAATAVGEAAPQRAHLLRRTWRHISNAAMRVFKGETNGTQAVTYEGHAAEGYTGRRRATSAPATSAETVATTTVPVESPVAAEPTPPAEAQPTKPTVSTALVLVPVRERVIPNNTGGQMLQDHLLALGFASPKVFVQAATNGHPAATRQALRRVLRQQSNLHRMGEFGNASAADQYKQLLTAISEVETQLGWGRQESADEAAARPAAAQQPHGGALNSDAERVAFMRRFRAGATASV